MTSKKVYLLSVGSIILTSTYPIYMGIVMILSYIQNGGIDVSDYPSYIIPYTPISIALILCTVFLPFVNKLCNRYALPALSVLGVSFFLVAETIFEQIAVFTDSSTKISIETWQLLSCIATPQVKNSIWDSLNIRYNPLFKIHFYAISALIVLSVISVIYGFYIMAYKQNFAKRKPLVAQLISVIVFIGLCIFACFTAFFRTGNIVVSPISAVLMTLFFLVFGITGGVYTGTWLYNKPKLVSIIIPSAVAITLTIFMYIGEMIMMGGALFKFGNGFLFNSIGITPLSLIDILTVLLSGVATYFILTTIKPKDPYYGV